MGEEPNLTTARTVLTGEGREGVGEEQNSTTARKPGPLLII